MKKKKHLVLELDVEVAPFACCSLFVFLDFHLSHCDFVKFFFLFKHHHISYLRLFFFMYDLRPLASLATYSLTPCCVYILYIYLHFSVFNTFF
jgi:hypothetical protein